MPNMRGRLLLSLVVGVLLVDLSVADIYLHNPRGSNNRWNENGRNRNNAKRMFDSQNNNRGGYNVGSLVYYVGSKLQIEWTNQHSCGNENNNCDIVLQYMCNDRVRDGTSTSTIPSNPTQCENLDCNEDRSYGMHEDFYHYHNCRLRSGNKGLYAADRNVRGHASSTRQNQNANRYGYECAEERDYYPNWHPSPWKDIAVMTNDVSRCSIYQQESQNVKDKYWCKVDPGYLYQYSNKNPIDYIPITQEGCEAFSYEVNGVTKNGSWTKQDAYHIPAPACVESHWSRDNHLGNGLGGETLNYNWTIPDTPNEHCVLRIRYNISTGDYDRDNTTSLHNNRRNRDGPGPDVWTKYGLTEEEGTTRGYQLKGDPLVDIFKLEKLKLQLAMDLQQYGRTFQDRSHTFAIRPRPPSLDSDAEIINVNVRGKRGNIVQVYPGVEYDFAPNYAVIKSKDYVHFQWTGSDNNPANNDGQGRQQTDRSNIVMLKSPVYVEGDPATYKTNTFGQLGSSYPSHLENASLGGLSRVEMMDLAILRAKQFRGDMVELDDAGTYYDLGPRKVTKTGKFNYMCTRNNNFSNRSQKGKLVVTDASFAGDYVGKQGGNIAVPAPGGGASSELTAPPEALASAKYVEVAEIPVSSSPVANPPPNTDYVSDVISVEPSEKLAHGDTKLRLQIRLNSALTSLYQPEIYYTIDGGQNWLKLAVEDHQNGYVALTTDAGGYYVVTKAVSAGQMAGLVLGLIVGTLLVIAISVALCRNKQLLANYKNKV